MSDLIRDRVQRLAANPRDTAHRFSIGGPQPPPDSAPLFEEFIYQILRYCPEEAANLEWYQRPHGSLKNSRNIKFFNWAPPPPGPPGGPRPPAPPPVPGPIIPVPVPLPFPYPVPVPIPVPIPVPVPVPVPVPAPQPARPPPVPAPAAINWNNYSLELAASMYPGLKEGFFHDHYCRVISFKFEFRNGKKTRVSPFADDQLLPLHHRFDRILVEKSAAEVIICNGGDVQTWAFTECKVQMERRDSRWGPSQPVYLGGQWRVFFFVPHAEYLKTWASPGYLAMVVDLLEELNVRFGVDTDPSRLYEYIYKGLEKDKIPKKIPPPSRAGAPSASELRARRRLQTRLSDNAFADAFEKYSQKHGLKPVPGERPSQQAERYQKFKSHAEAKKLGDNTLIGLMAHRFCSYRIAKAFLPFPGESEHNRQRRRDTIAQSNWKQTSTELLSAMRGFMKDSEDVTFRNWKELQLERYRQYSSPAFAKNFDVRFSDNPMIKDLEALYARNRKRVHGWRRKKNPSDLEQAMLKDMEFFCLAGSGTKRNGIDPVKDRNKHVDQFSAYFRSNLKKCAVVFEFAMSLGRSMQGMGTYLDPHTLPGVPPYRELGIQAPQNTSMSTSADGQDDPLDDVLTEEDLQDHDEDYEDDETLDATTIASARETFFPDQEFTKIHVLEEYPDDVTDESSSLSIGGPISNAQGKKPALGRAADLTEGDADAEREAEKELLRIGDLLNSRRQGRE